MSNFISWKELKSLIQDPDLIVVDTSFNLKDPNEKYQDFIKERIEGAIYAHLDEDLSGIMTEKTGRHPLPELESFKMWLTNNNFSSISRVVIYDNFNGGLAARLWFMLTQLGFTWVKLYLGGIEEWKNHGNKVDTGIPAVSDANLSLELPDSWEQGKYKIFYANQIKELISKDNFQLVDSRAPERYRGETEPYDPIKGHIPSAANHFWNSNLTQNGKLRDLNELKLKFKSLITEDEENTIFYCGSGVTACFNVAVAQEIGIKTSIYIGSWSDWINHYPELLETD